MSKRVHSQWLNDSRSTGAHPPAGSCIPDGHGRCITCSDELQRATVLELDNELLLAKVALEGETVEIDISLVAGVEKDDVLLVHGGVALERELL